VASFISEALQILRLASARNPRFLAPAMDGSFENSPFKLMRSVEQRFEDWHSKRLSGVYKLNRVRHIYTGGLVRVWRETSLELAVSVAAGAVGRRFRSACMWLRRRVRSRNSRISTGGRKLPQQIVVANSASRRQSLSSVFSLCRARTCCELTSSSSSF
jgi:hypothetical protein